MTREASLDPATRYMRPEDVGVHQMMHLPIAPRLPCFFCVRWRACSGGFRGITHLPPATKMKHGAGPA